jgi:hypothetical protein
MLTSSKNMLHLYLLNRWESSRKMLSPDRAYYLKSTTIRSLHVVTVGEMGDSVISRLPKLCSTTMRMP